MTEKELSIKNQLDQEVQKVKNAQGEMTNKQAEYIGWLLASKALMRMNRQTKTTERI